MTQALGTFGVYGRPGDAEIEILTLADQYREKLCHIQWDRHRAITDLRNAAFPDLFSAMAEMEAVSASIWIVEKDIKAHHSDVRDRNAVMLHQRNDLESLRIHRKQLQSQVSTLRKRWVDVLRARAMHWKTLADWKDVKSLSAREELYSLIDWPSDSATYAALDTAGKLTGPVDPTVVEQLGRLEMDFDLRLRRLSAEYQSLGLHSAIRAEIVESSEPKLKKDGPGMRYEYGRKPDPKPWEKLSLHFPQGLKFADCLSGKCKSLSFSPVYTQHKASRSHTVYRVRQQIGTADKPRVIEYRVKMTRELRDEDTIHRFSLVVRPNGKREMIPIVKRDIEKPTGTGTFAFDLSWRRAPSGIQVCHFLGEHVNERLILPQWLIDRRLAVTAAQERCDREANELLESLGSPPQPDERQGVAALETFVATHPAATGAGNTLDDLTAELSRARRMMQRAVRCIEKIYETAAYRVCSRHAGVVADPIDLQTVKRYDTRDLLRYDPLPSKSREYLAAVSPGKLSALLTHYGLASVDVLPKNLEVARESDLFTSYVQSMAVATGPKLNAMTNRSQHAVGIGAT